LVETVLKRAPHLTAVREPTTPAVVHFIDRELIDASGYGLDRKVSMQFLGTPLELIESLTSQVKSIGPVESVQTGKPSELIDRRTQIKVEAHEQPVRQILSDAVSGQQKRSRLLWDAHSKRVKGSPIATTISIPIP